MQQGDRRGLLGETQLLLLRPTKLRFVKIAAQGGENPSWWQYDHSLLVSHYVLCFYYGLKVCCKCTWSIWGAMHLEDDFFVDLILHCFSGVRLIVEFDARSYFMLVVQLSKPMWTWFHVYRVQDPWGLEGVSESGIIKGRICDHKSTKSMFYITVTQSVDELTEACHFCEFLNILRLQYQKVLWNKWWFQ